MVILGDLQINGTTTTINSVNLSISDKNIVLADSAINAAQATGAGITVGTYASNPTITYDGTTDRWDFNRSIEVTGDITFSDSDDLILPDNSKIKIGTSGDLQIYHNGSTSYIADVGTGLLQLRTNGTRIELVGQSGAEYMARFEQDGPVKLYYDAVQKFATTSTGVEVTGEVTADSATISGSLTVDTDTLFVDAANNRVGIGTASPAATLDVNGHMAIDTDSGQTSSIDQTSIATFTAATFSGAKLVVTAKDGSNRYISELLITHNGTTAVATEYGQVATSSALATYDVDINGGNVRLLATPVSTNPTTFKVMKLLLID